jgi:hypothetical protein
MKILPAILVILAAALADAQTTGTPIKSYATLPATCQPNTVAMVNGSDAVYSCCPAGGAGCTPGTYTQIGGGGGTSVTYTGNLNDLCSVGAVSGGHLTECLDSVINVESALATFGTGTAPLSILTRAVNAGTPTVTCTGACNGPTTYSVYTAEQDANGGFGTLAQGNVNITPVFPGDTVNVTPAACNPGSASITVFLQNNTTGNFYLSIHRSCPASVIHIVALGTLAAPIVSSGGIVTNELTFDNQSFIGGGESDGNGGINNNNGNGNYSLSGTTGDISLDNGGITSGYITPGTSDLYVVGSVCVGTASTCPSSIGSNSGTILAANGVRASGATLGYFNGSPQTGVVQGSTLYIPCGSQPGAPMSVFTIYCDSTAGALEGSYENGTFSKFLFSNSSPGLFPTLNQSTTGNAATATALASAPTLCSSGQAPTGVLASGNATGCTAYATSGYLKGTTGSIGGSALLAGACASGTASITGVAAGTPCTAACSTGIYLTSSVAPNVYALGTASGTATVYVCAIVAITPTACTYAVSCMP